MELHERLRHLLEDHNLTQSAVAASLSVSASTVNGWMKGTAPCAEIHLTRLVIELIDALDLDAKHALLAELFQLRERARVTTEDENKWLPELRGHALAAIEKLRPDRAPLRQGHAFRDRSLLVFPDAFYPLTIISGDKREDSESRINRSDFGAVSASPAEARWIMKLGLREDTEFFTDKIFVLESAEELRQRFSGRNLLVIGSPASNHLARRIHLVDPIPGWRKAVPVFRFNVRQDSLQEIETLLKTLEPYNAKQLVGQQGDQETGRRVKHWLKWFFTGGIIDPSYDLFLRGFALPLLADFGLISLARNPFSANDDVLAVLVSGFHMFGTAHAIRMLSDRTEFESHPYGGVLRVAIHGDGFGKRFDRSEATWDTDSDYTRETLISGLRGLAQACPPSITLAESEFAETLELLENL